MKLFTGIDIIEVARVKNNIEDFGDKFLNKIYTKEEIEYCESKSINKYQSYAGRFAAKEAVFKAISPLLDNKYHINWKDIEIVNDKNGRPLVNLYNNEIFNLQNIKIDISISHIKDTAVANVVLISGKKDNADK